MAAVSRHASDLPFYYKPRNCTNDTNCYFVCQKFIKPFGLDLKIIIDNMQGGIRRPRSLNRILAAGDS